MVIAADEMHQKSVQHQQRMPSVFCHFIEFYVSLFQPGLAGRKSRFNAGEPDFSCLRLFLLLFYTAPLLDNLDAFV